MGENAQTDVCSVGVSYNYARTTALELALRQHGHGAPTSRVIESAEAFYTFLTAKS